MPPKKGKDKAAAAAAVAAAAAAAATKPPSKSSSGKKKSGAVSTIGSTAPADSDFIVFTNSNKESRPKPVSKIVVAGGPETAAADGPPKPTVKQIIGGASWTGKLPVNMLSEHCQKQKWDKPDYDVRKVKDGFSAFVSLSARNNKTGEVTRLEPFKLPPSHVHLAIQPTALEARHFAATYGLFRVCSMKNMHMTLPPAYKSLWREFGTLKTQDVRDGRAWMYEADPFLALRERELAKQTAEKKRQEQQAAREKAASRDGLEGTGGLRAGGGSTVSGGTGRGESRAWSNNVPRIEMGSKTRTNLEDLLRRGSIWNPQGVVLTAAVQRGIVEELVKLGFRPSHVEEAVALCQDRTETLEWLLVHVPEDDLPRWALPESYTAGVSVAATDLRREAAIVRLAQSGYAVDLCRKLLDASDGDEGRAAARLQAVLVGGSPEVEAEVETNGPSSYDSADECWEAELASLESVFGAEQFRRVSEAVCEIQLSGVVNVVQGEARPVAVGLQFRRAAGYPAELLVAVVAPQLPAYIRLSIVRQVLAQANVGLRGEEMKMYFVADWAQQHINAIIERPGRLSDIAAAASTASEATGDGNRTSSLAAEAAPRKRTPRHPRAIAWAADENSRQDWLRRQEAPGYQKMLAQRRRLPAWEAREAVVAAVRMHQVTIIAGETGSGKSTQSPQFLLDDLYNRGLGSAANIVVTQPRRISALGLAERVSEERCCSVVGEEVGYIIRGESRVSGGGRRGGGGSGGGRTNQRTARITFVTTGVLLRRLQVSGGRPEDVVAALADVSHVVIDEVHERSLDTDFLLSILRDVLRQRADLRLVLMSATLDAATFRDYFARDGLSVASVEIAGRTFPVEDLYLDDVIRATGFGLDGAGRRGGGGGDNEADPVAKAIQQLGSRINYGLVADTVRAIDEELTRTNDAGAVLVFLPGVAEINQVCGMLGGGRGGDGGDGDRKDSLYILPLHAGLETREQKRVFAAAPTGRRKVVVATNVAETSITIDDVVAVVDTGRVKETSLDVQTGMRRLAETWVSLAAAKQRRGRAGRVRPGHCYKLYTRALESQQMPPRPEPEIRRVPLEQLCLAVRAMGIADVAGFLARAPSPPDVAAVDGALLLLRRMGILGGNTASNTLTSLGKLVAAIPADLRCAKLMVYGALFGCLHPCVTMAAILSSGRAGGPFVSVPPDRRQEAKAARMRFAAPGTAADGDLLTDLRAVLRWDDVVAENQNRGGGYRYGNSAYSSSRQVRAFCDDNFLSQQALADISTTRQQLYDAMADMGIRPEKTSSASSASSISFPLLRALTAAAFNPQIARIQLPDQKFAASVSGTVALDPEARTIRYFARDHGRVFIHPSSTLFDSHGFGGRAVFLSYFTSMATSKVFIRDLTPFNAYTLLMFAGDIDLDTLGRGLIVDGWLRLRGWARIGVLVSRLRGMVDRLIARRLGQGDSDDDPDRDVPPDSTADTEQIDRDILKAVVRLIELDGLDS
ncbi:dead deah box DNA helicase [Grosmannia clavigera kw1407]|uniref:Dead deah box DNA helicase n=1 Tax=Grosmannia clavigera (strain kw1407 / UAMH 11150) TaxID=655863 RepID=F0XLN2_GROCL|nr:dead deah box DNA helicase [Grosmannia clavigera kw1407]EFX01197.1 dead deah box DNA helicase [Grosmannia clavigera kw1407]